MPSGNNEIKPWWREPWPWILMAGPFITIIGCAITIVLAIQSFANEPIIVDGEKRGLVVSKKPEKASSVMPGYRSSVSGSKRGDS